MTEYGRGAGHQPWHPEDPLYGDQGWAGQQAEHGQGPYGGQPQHYQQEPQQPYYDGQQQHYNQQQQYGDNGGWDTGQHQQQPQQQHPNQQHPHHPQPHQHQHPQQEPVPYGINPAADPYAGQQPAYGTGESHDYYAAPEAYPPPQPPNQRRTEPGQAPEWAPEQEEPETHPFFTGGDDRDDDDPEEPRESRRGRGSDRRGGKSKKKKKKSRNGTACLFVTLVLAGGAGGIAYFGYQFWQNQFGPAPDYSGMGSGSAEVVIPQGAGGYEIGRILQKEGVVKSQDAFVAAQTRNPKGRSIQAGVYTLNKGMSADNAVAQMLKPSSRNALVIFEGARNAQVYELIDKRLGEKPGTTQDVAKAQADKLGLPDWAGGHKNVKDPLEGFLFPASYPVAKSAKPEDVLKKMVARANQEYTNLDVEAESKRLGLKNPWELITVASLVQVEGKTHDDFRRMGEVVYNRLKPTNTETNQLLQFDSAFNYLKGQSEIKISESEINSNMDPYNTYTQRGLTPGPISNPGNEALAAALNPTKDGWLYFVATDGMNKTEFAKTHTEFLKLKDKFDASQGSN